MDLSTEKGSSTLFIRLLNQNDKGEALAQRIAALREGLADEDVYAVNPKSFRQVPNTPFCYWVSERIRWLFKELSPFESDGRTVKQGLATADDFRFVRVWWEVPAERILDSGRCTVSSGQEKPEQKWTDERIREFQAWCRKRTYEGKRWAPFAKGGEYSPYYADIHLVVNWENEGAEIRNFVDPKTGKINSRPQNTDYYFRPGLTWSDRTNKDFGPRPMQAGTIISVKGSGGFAAHDILWGMLGLMCSRFFISMMDLIVGSTTLAKSYQVGTIGRVPTFNATLLDTAIAAAAKRCHDLRRASMALHETERTFLGCLRASGAESLSAIHAATQTEQTSVAQDVVQCQNLIDDKTFSLCGITSLDRASLRQGVLGSPLADSTVNDTQEMASTEEDKEDLNSIRLSYDGTTSDVMSFAFGSVLGRWDTSIARGERQPSPLSDPFDPLPVCPPGMLQGPDGLPAKPEDVPSDYPIRIAWDGILADDPGHEDDIVRSVRDVLEVIWPEGGRQRAVGSRQKENVMGGKTAYCIPPTAYSIEQEACEILGVRELRDYFRKPGNGGFWMDHVKRYSKSRRKAPIYWYLRSAKGNYGLWLYYHRLDKDILFKALLNYVEPKIRQVSMQYAEGSRQLEKAKENRSETREIRRLEKEMDRLDALLSELKDFEERLRRVANLHLDFDLNDGVILNIAPLWELVPWSEPKKYWEELQEGKYDWAHIAMQLWPERVQEACRKDRSIAIAHGREDLREVPPPKPRRSAEKSTPSGEEQSELDW